MGDCPECGSTDPGAVDSCPNPQCRTHPGGASADSPPQPASQGPPADAQRMAVAPPRQSAGQPATQTRPGPEPPAAGPPADPQSPVTPQRHWWQTGIFAGLIPTVAAIATIATLAIALFPVPKPGTPMVPVVGQVNEATAVQMLKEAHYEPDVIPAADDTIQKGMASKTDPAGGTPLPPGQHVKLYISTGPCNPVCKVTVPATKGKTEADARAVLGNAGFTVDRVVLAPSDLPVGTVTETSPEELTEAPTNVPVVVIVSSGPPSSGPPGPPSSGPPSPLPRDSPPLGPPGPLSSNNPPPPTPTPPPPTPPPPTPTPPPPPKRTCPPTSLADQPTAAGLEIASPGSGAWLKGVNEGHGTARRASGEHLWLLLCAPGIHLFYFVTDGHSEVPVSNDTWHAQFYVNTNWPGEYFLYAVIVNTEDSQRLDQTRINGGESPSVSELPQSARYFRVAVQCCS